MALLSGIEEFIGEMLARAADADDLEGMQRWMDRLARVRASKQRKSAEQ